MKTINLSRDTESRLSRMNFRNPQLMNVIRMVSRVVTLLFLVALIWAIYQSVVNNNLLPVWARLGIVILFAIAIGLVAVVIYRAVAEQVGPFDFSPSGRLAGQLKSETQRVEANGAN